MSVILFRLRLVALHDVVAETGCLGYIIEVLLLVDGVDALVSLEGLALGLEEVLTVGLQVIVVVAIAETLPSTTSQSTIRHTLRLLHPVTAIIILGRGRGRGRIEKR